MDWVTLPQALFDGWIVARILQYRYMLDYACKIVGMD